ncbi:lactadherin-like [Acanthaster planci]|uniref:Lactadherin-like n=1 Tax=Acanthaster planci TaxID=133434 RepID=A0A8B7ZJ70_ACAPL|nr:lactadherin-like [Acanthaster planci]
MSTLLTWKMSPAILVAVGLQLIGAAFSTASSCQCFIGQENEPATNRMRWALPYKNPCKCSSVQLGGVNMVRPLRLVQVPYVDASFHLPEIRTQFNCSIKYGCSEEKPLGMEDGRIPKDSITASSYFRKRSDHGPARARLNTQGVAAAWCCDEIQDPDHPWIQVEFESEVYVTGLVTQSRGGDSNNRNRQRVTRFRVAHSNDGASWKYVTGTNGTPKEFIGNSESDDYDDLATARLGTVVRTKFLRILPTTWNGFCSMRFEVLGCYENSTFTFYEAVTKVPPSTHN